MGLPLKKEFGEGGLEAQDKKAEATGLEALSAKWKPKIAEAEQEASEAKERPRSFFERVKNLFQKEAAALPGEETSALEKNAKEMDAAMKELKEAEARELAEEQREEIAETHELFERLKGKPAQKMVAEFFEYKQKIGQTDERGQIGDVRLDERRGELRIDYEDGSSLHKYPTGLILHTLPNHQLDVIESPFMPKKPKPELKVAPQQTEAKAAPKAEPASPPNWEKDTKEAEEALREIRKIKTAGEMRAFMVDRKFMSPEALARLSDEELKGVGKTLRDELMAHGGIVAEPIGREPDIAGKMRAANQAMQNEAEQAIVQQDIDRGVAEHEAEQAETAAAIDRSLDEEEEIFTPDEAAQLKSGVVSGETESKPEPAMPVEEPSMVVAPEATKLTIKTSEDAPTASGEIGGKKEKPKSPREVYPDLPKPKDGSFPPGVPDHRVPPPPRNPAKRMILSDEEAGAVRAEAAKMQAEQKLNPTAPETMAAVAKKMHELGYAGEKIKDVASAEQLRSVLKESGIDIDMGTNDIMLKGFYKSWLKEQKKFKPEPAKKGKKSKK